MNYCNGRDYTDFPPTGLDLLGMEMLYPALPYYPIACSNGCFLLDPSLFQNGASGVATRTDGFITTDWTARGGLNVFLRDPVTNEHTVSLATSGLPLGSAPTLLSFASPTSDSLLNTYGTVVNSYEFHAAIVMTIL